MTCCVLLLSSRLLTNHSPSCPLQLCTPLHACSLQALRLAAAFVRFFGSSGVSAILLHRAVPRQWPRTRRTIMEDTQVGACWLGLA